MEELNARSTKNARVDGYGLDVTQHMPCPFCGAADWAAWQTVAGIAPGDDRPNLDAQMREPKMCSSCGRAAKVIVTRAPGTMSAEFVQVGGPEQPEWFEPKMRVVEE